MDKKRKKISPELRDGVLVEVGHRCSRCNSEILEVDIHHMRPVADGGTNEYENLVVLCANCHRLAHRYKLSPKQLTIYKEQAILRYHLSGGPWGFSRTIRTQETIEVLLESLQAHIEGWHTQLVETAARMSSNGADSDPTENIYINTRQHLPHVLAIRNVLDEHDHMPELVADVDVFLGLLTTRRTRDLGEY